MDFDGIYSDGIQVSDIQFDFDELEEFGQLGEVEFRVDVYRGHTTSIGVGVLGESDPLLLRISSLSLVGAIATWNEDHPAERVRVGDSILEVNGIRDNVMDMVEECQTADRLSLVVRTTCHRGDGKRRCDRAHVPLNLPLREVANTLVTAGDAKSRVFH
mmetsp:Transcript_56091/g.149652  ORF Transcript_56091/g.149652 Transcript_56091/m.149652 type:complete len:159 (-) Transcript_56091:192-668(-)